jgi:hypothetical protein
MATEQTIPILSFLTFFALQLLGALWHYRVVVKSGRHMGGLWSYLMGDYKTTTVPMIAALFGTSLYAAITGTADFINPTLVWSVLASGQLPLTSFGMAVPIVTSGYTWDSALNSGDNEPK